MDRRDPVARQQFAVLARNFMRQCGQYMRVVDMTRTLPTDAVTSEILVILCGTYVIGKAFHFASFFLLCTPNIYTCKACGERIPEPRGFHFYPAAVYAFMNHTRESGCMIVNLCDALGEFDPYYYRRPMDRVPRDVQYLRNMPALEAGDDDDKDDE